MNFIKMTVIINSQMTLKIDGESDKVCWKTTRGSSSVKCHFSHCLRYLPHHSDVEMSSPTPFYCKALLMKSCSILLVHIVQLCVYTGPSVTQKCTQIILLVLHKCDNQTILTATLPRSEQIVPSPGSLCVQN